jgi:hypothetical protein
MADIKVSVVTIGGEKHDVEVPPDIKAEDFIKELISALKLPITDAEGHTISWRLDNKDTGRTLDAGRTIDENGVREGHQLMLIRATTAGN